MLYLPPELEELIASGRFEKRVMMRVEFDDGPEGIWNGDYDVTVAGVEYSGLAGNMQLGDLISSLDLDADIADVNIGGLLPVVQQMLSGGEWHQRPAVLSIAFLNLAGEVVGVIPRFSGFLDDAPVTDAADDLVIVQAKVESNNRGLSRSSNRTRSDNDQRQVPGASNDGIYKYTGAVAVDVNIPWGRKGEQYPVRPR